MATGQGQQQQQQPSILGPGAVNAPVFPPGVRPPMSYPQSSFPSAPSPNVIGISGGVNMFHPPMNPNVRSQMYPPRPSPLSSFNPQFSRPSVHLPRMHSPSIPFFPVNSRLPMARPINLMTIRARLPLVSTLPSPSPPLQDKPQTTLYVGKIPSTVEDSFLKKILEVCGPVKSWKRATDPTTQVQKGFGFCEFENAEGVLRALRILKNLALDGQQLLLNVNQATKQYLETYVSKKKDGSSSEKITTSPSPSPLNPTPFENANQEESNQIKLDPSKQMHDEQVGKNESNTNTNEKESLKSELNEEGKGKGKGEEGKEEVKEQDIIVQNNESKGKEIEEGERKDMKEGKNEEKEEDSAFAFLLKSDSDGDESVLKTLNEMVIERSKSLPLPKEEKGEIEEEAKEKSTEEKRKEREKERSREKDRVKEKGKERTRDRERDRDRGREKEKERDKENERDKDKGKERNREKASSKERDNLKTDQSQSDSKNDLDETKSEDNASDKGKRRLREIEKEKERVRDRIEKVEKEKDREKDRLLRMEREKERERMERERIRRDRESVARDMDRVYDQREREWGMVEKQKERVRMHEREREKEREKERLRLIWMQEEESEDEEESRRRNKRDGGYLREEKSRRKREKEEDEEDALKEKEEEKERAKRTKLEDEVEEIRIKALTATVVDEVMAEVVKEISPLFVKDKTFLSSSSLSAEQQVSIASDINSSSLLSSLPQSMVSPSSNTMFPPSSILKETVLSSHGGQKASKMSSLPVPTAVTLLKAVEEEREKEGEAKDEEKLSADSSMANDQDSSKTIKVEDSVSEKMEVQETKKRKAMAMAISSASKASKLSLSNVFGMEGEDENIKQKMGPLIPIDYDEDMSAMDASIASYKHQLMMSSSSSSFSSPSSDLASAKPPVQVSTAKSSQMKPPSPAPASVSPLKGQGSSFLQAAMDFAKSLTQNGSKEEKRGDRGNREGRGKEEKEERSKKRPITDVKSLIDSIPTSKDGLFSITVNWEVYDNHKLHEKMEPWIGRKVKEFLGEEEASLVEFIVSSVKDHLRGEQILELLKPVLDEEAELFVLKMWRMLIFEIRRVEMGLI